jgi:hypothetical protein
MYPDATIAAVMLAIILAVVIMVVDAIVVVAIMEAVTVIVLAATMPVDMAVIILQLLLATVLLAQVHAYPTTRVTSITLGTGKDVPGYGMALSTYPLVRSMPVEVAVGHS